MLFEQLYRLILEEMGEKAYAWLSPDGTFFPIRPSEVHASWARKYVTAHYPKNTLAYRNSNDYLAFLMQKGWMRILYIGNNLYVNNTKSRPNNRQMRELKNVAIEYQADRIMFDNDETDRVIWSNENIL